MQSLHTCSSSRAGWLTGIVALTLASSACALTGIDPDEIDIADDGADEVGQDEGGSETALDTAATGENNQDTGDTSGGSDSGADTTGAGSTTDDTTGGDPASCDATGELSLGDNPVDVPMSDSLLEGACGGSGGESIYSFTAAVAGDYTFAVTAGDIPAILYAIDAQCGTIEGACGVDANGFVMTLASDETVFIVVDTDGAGGAATVAVTGP